MCCSILQCSECLYHLGIDELLEVCTAELPVPLISDVTTVYDLSEQITQILPWYLSHTY